MKNFKILLLVIFALGLTPTNMAFADAAKVPAPEIMKEKEAPKKIVIKKDDKKKKDEKKKEEVKKPVSFMNLFIETAYADDAAPAASPAAPVAVASPVPLQTLQSAVTPPSSDDFAALLKGLGGMKGAGTLAIIALIVQMLMFFFRTQLANFAGVYQLLVVNALTLIAGVLALKLQGMDWLAAIMNSQVLGMAQIFGHQVFTQIQKKPADQAAIAAPAKA